MEQTVNSLMRRYGQSVEVLRAGEITPARAFLQPMASREERQAMPTPLGVRREDQFLYLGQAQVELKAGESRVRWQGGVYQVRSAHPIYVGRELSHWWAVLVPADKEEA